GWGPYIEDLRDLKHAWLSETEVYLDKRGNLKDTDQAEAELSAHCQHGAVVRQHRAVDALYAMTARVLDQMPHQPRAHTLPREMAQHQDGVLGLAVVGIGGQPRDGMNLAFALGGIDQREGHVAIVIELRVARRLCMREHLHRTQETVADFLRRHAVEGALQCRFVFGADRPQQHAAAIRQLERRFQFARIGPYAQATAGLAMEIGRASCRER